MGDGLRSLVAIAISVGLAIPAGAAAFSSCWVTQVQDPDTGFMHQVTRCRIAGGDVIDYTSDGDVPSVLYAQTGTDLSGQCWYYTSAPTQYVILAQYADGSADIGFDTDPSVPGGIVAIGPTLPRCTSEPVPVADPRADAWAYVTQYIHPPPTPELSPATGDGVTGLETFVGVPVPDLHTTQIGSGSSTLDIYIEVSVVVVDWGDGTAKTYPATDRAMAGYPDGFATHVYETKNEDGVPITVSYDWTARWRVAGGAWEALAVPDTETTVVYPIAEVVSDLTG